MDKRIIFAVAGSGKTTYILEQLTLDSRSLVITYTNNNVRNLRIGIIKKFGFFPENISLLSYFTFLYSFCFKPLLSYKFKTKGISYKPNSNKYAKETTKDYYFNREGRIFSNRISKKLQKEDEIANVNARLEKYYDNLFVDEIQDIGGNDFNFLKNITEAKINILLVGDFHQHTFDTSRDGAVNKQIHNDFGKYKERFRKMGLNLDTDSLDKSWRCSPSICKFISDNLGIAMESHKKESTIVSLVEDEKKMVKVFNDKQIVKLFYKEHYKYKCYSRNWGDSKGENHYNDVCVVLNKIVMNHYLKDTLSQLKPLTKNKLYVACSRARNNLYLIAEDNIKQYKK